MNSSNLPDKSRRKILVAGAKLGVAGAVGSGLGTGLIQPAYADNWYFEQFQPSPENTAWRIIDSHETGFVTPDVGWKRKNCGHLGRVSFTPPADGKKSFCHVVRKGGIVHPLGIDSEKFIADFSTFSRVLLRYHQWIDDYAGIEGKWICLMLGRGWVGRGHPKPANALYGDDGCSATTMHPVRNGGNGMRMLVIHKGQKSPYGKLVGKGRNLVPTGTWVTCDVIIEKDVGYRLYVNGVEQGSSTGMRPVGDWNACRSIWYRTRLMHGGTPDKLPAIRDYKEWYGGFYVGVA